MGNHLQRDCNSSQLKCNLCVSLNASMVNAKIDVNHRRLSKLCEARRLALERKRDMIDLTDENEEQMEATTGSTHPLSPMHSPFVTNEIEIGRGGSTPDSFQDIRSHSRLSQVSLTANDDHSSPKKQFVVRNLAYADIDEHSVTKMTKVQTKEYMVPIYIEPQNVKFHGEEDSRYATFTCDEYADDIIREGKITIEGIEHSCVLID